MGLFDRLRSWRSMSRASRVTTMPRTRELAAAMDAARNTRSTLRRYEGAAVDRLTASWMTTNVAIDEELRRDLDRLRARSRDLWKNNEHAAKFARLVRNNVVGPEGFTFHSRAANPDGSLDTADCRAIEAAVWDWSKPRHCDVAGRRSFVDLCRLAVTAMARDGEFLFKRVRNAGKYGYQLQPLNVDRLDTTFNRAPTQGSNAVIMGVEVDTARRPVAYHIWTSPPTLGADPRRVRERVPASEILHGFIPLEEEQTRGVPWMHAAMRILNDLKGYREAAVIAARIGASKMGIWVTPDGAPPGGDNGGIDAATGSVITDVQPGSFDYAPAGYTFKEFDPTYPHDQFDAFCKATLRGVASAIGAAYSTLANDLENVNYSSIRAGVLDERDEWMVIQNVVINVFLVPVFEDLIEMALLRGAVRLPTGSALPAAKLDKFSEHLWQGRRWQWVDPEKDINAAVTALQHRLASPQQIAMQTGRDVDDILDDWVAFEAMCQARGMPVPTFNTASAPPAPPPDPNAAK